MASDPTFEPRVCQQIERLKTASLAQIEHETAEKRLAWFRQQAVQPAGPDSPRQAGPGSPQQAGPGSPRQAGPGSPRQAFELLFFEYMGLAEADLPVVAESADEIVWLSQNPCPTLEACRRLGWDTRRVCRAAYERSTQALISQLDPELRFRRSYEAIRPYGPHCREWIVRMDFAAWMRKALALEAGAVVVLDQQLLGSASGSEPHPAGRALQQAQRSSPDLTGAVLFTPRRPCPACLRQAGQARLTTLVYGFCDSAATPAYSSGVELVGGVLEAECRAAVRAG